MGLVPVLFPMSQDFLKDLPYLGYYFTGNESVGYVGISIASTARRAIILLTILVLSASAVRNKHYAYSERLHFLLKIYATGALLFCLFIAVPSAGTRFFAVFQMLELALIPLLCRIRQTLQWQIRILSVMFCIVLTWNVLSQFVIERDYKYAKWYSYPYYSVFTPIEIVQNDRPSLYDLP